MFDLTPQELSRTIWNLDDFQVSSEDTLKPHQFERFKKFYDEHKSKIFSLGSYSALYTFPGRSSLWNGKTYEENTDHHNAFTYLCHYYWTCNACKHTTGLLNMFPNNVRPKVNAEFWKYLLSPTESPYRDVLKDLYVLRSSKEDTKGFPEGILWTNTDKTDVLLLTHMLITSRLLTGWALDIVFLKLIQMGFSKPVAMLLSVLFEFNKQDVTGSESFGVHFKHDSTDPIKGRLTAFGPHTSDQPFGRSEYDGGWLSNWNNLSPKKFINGDYTTEEYNTLPKTANLSKTNQLWFGDHPILTGQLGAIEEDEDSFDEKHVKKEDAWGLFAQVKGTKPVDPGIVAEIENRMQNDIPLDFNIRN